MIAKKLERVAGAGGGTGMVQGQGWRAGAASEIQSSALCLLSILTKPEPCTQDTLIIFPLLAPSLPSFLTRTLPTSSLLVCQAMKMEARTTRLALRVRACAVLKARSYVRPYVCTPPSLLGAGPVSHVSASQPDLLHQ